MRLDLVNLPLAQTGKALLGLSVLRMLAAARAILHQHHASRVIPQVLLAGIVTFLALVAGERNHRAYIFLLRSHFIICGRSNWPSLL